MLIVAYSVDDVINLLVHIIQSIQYVDGVNCILSLQSSSQKFHDLWFKKLINLYLSVAKI